MNTSTTPKTFGNPPIEVKDVVDERGNTYCQVHPTTETGLRCNNCGRLMCAKCAVHTPVGYRCEQCVRQRENAFFNADALYYVKLVGITAVLSAVGAFLAGIVGIWLFLVFIGAAAGGAISQVVIRFTKGQRGRYAGQAAAGAVIAGTLLMVLVRYYFAIQIPPEVRAVLATLPTAEADAYRALLQVDFFTYAFRSLGVWVFAGVTAVVMYGRFNMTRR
ncbi:MAG: B-box zinc finger protein [Phototrophicaceae bacterium]|jgi:hypothetical protein